MSIYHLLILIASLLFGQAVFYLLFFEKKTQASKELAIVCVAFFIYSFFSFLIQTADKHTEVYMYYRFLAVGFVGIPVSVTYFIFRISRFNEIVIGNIIRFYIIPAYLILLVQYIINPTQFRVYSFIDGLWVYEPIYSSPWVYFNLFNYFVCGAISFYMLYRWKTDARTKRESKQAIIMFYFLGILFLTALINNYFAPYISLFCIAVIDPVNSVVWGGVLFFAYLKLKPQLISPEILNFLIIGQMKDIVIFLDLETKIISANSSFFNLLGYNFADLQRIYCRELFANPDMIDSIIEKSRDNEAFVSIVTNICSKKREELPVSVSCLNNEDSVGNQIGYVIVCSDYRPKLVLKQEIADRLNREKEIQKIKRELEYLVEKKTNEIFKANERLKNEIYERTRVEEQIKSDLNKKNELVQEIHHRVKNNIQMIISLINMLPSHEDVDESSAQRFKEIGEKVRSISEVHEVFYSLPRLSKINFGEYLKKTTGEIYSQYQGKKNIIFKLNIASVDLDIDRAIPCGIIFVELLINTLKYAFYIDSNNQKSRNNNIVEIGYYKENKKYFLSVSDNNAGKEWINNTDISLNIGLNLVNFLVKDHLKGKLTISSIDGTKFLLEF
ncbi:MAG: histidine kinase dimerization/phosphoacceptor domain -containing protein [Bacteroidota bacterium]